VQGENEKITLRKHMSAIWLLATSIAVLAVLAGVRALDVSLGNKKNNETPESRSSSRPAARPEFPRIVVLLQSLQRKNYWKEKLFILPT
jgi:hypothetical protein